MCCLLGVFRYSFDAFTFKACAWNITEWDSYIIPSRSAVGFQIYLLKTKHILHIESGWRACFVWSLLKDEYQLYLGHSDLLFTHTLAWCHVFPPISTYKLMYWFFVLFFTLCLFCHFSWRTWCTIERVTTTKSCCGTSTCPGLRTAQSLNPAGHLSTWVFIHHLMIFSLTLSMWSSNLHICFSYFMSAPEVVARHRYGRPVDCWAVGVIMYIL